jgi:predicted TPR repeat methyltransferase
MHRGVDGWASSDVHARSEVAQTVEEQRAVYAQWASTYDAEMLDNNLSSYQSVTNVVCGLLSKQPPGPLRVLDAGCGTGLLGEHLCKSAFPRKLTITGADLSPNMLAVARLKRCYEKLLVADLNDPTSSVAEEDLFDYTVSSGLFLPGHCGVKAFSHLLRTVKPGGFAAFTVREGLYARDKLAFADAVIAEGGELLRDDLAPYYGSLNANLVVVSKIATP